MKWEIKLKAIRLRKKGLTYSQILDRIPVAKSTLCRWLDGLALTTEQEIRLMSGRQLSRVAAARVKRQRKIDKIRKLTTKGEYEFPLLINKPLFLAGLMLYWAEGDKHKEERVKFTNSDGNLIWLMMRWFREVCKVPEEKFRIAVHIHNLHSRVGVKSYWAKTTGVPTHRFHKLYVKNTSLGQRRNVLYNGTCAIVINNKDLFRNIVGWKIGLLKHFGIPPRSSMDRTKDF